MKLGKKPRYDIVVREWKSSKVVKQRVISPIYDTSVDELVSLIKKMLRGKK